VRDSLKDRHFRHHKNLRLIEGDLLEHEKLAQALETTRPTHIVHCAAVAGIDTVIKRPVHTLEVNMVGTAHVLRAAVGLERVERVVCFSSSEVFGETAFQSDENAQTVIGRIGVARWTYAVSKLSGEHLAIAYHTQHGLPTTVLRPFNIYGPGQVGEGALSRFVQRALKGQDLEIHGDGTQIRAWCYIDDMVRGVLLALTHPGAVGETFNIGNQRAVVTIYGLANTVIRVLKAASEVRFVRKDYADIELRVPSVGKARDVLGFEAEVELEEGIERTAAYYSRLA
jgi:UDP-glucose 4-epimerase